jgi:hypothetical protein
LIPCAAKDLEKKTAKRIVQDNRAGCRRVGPTCGFTASPEVGLGGHCRYPADRVLLHASFKSRQGVERAPIHRHVPCSIEPDLPAKVGSRASMCPVTLDPTSQIGRAPTSSRVPWLQTPDPYKGVLRCAMCPTALNPSCLQGRALERRLSYSFRSCLPTGRASVLPPHALWFPVNRRPQAYRKS